MMITPYTEKIRYKKISFEMAIANRDFSRANELEDELSFLYLNGTMVFSELIEEMENFKKKAWRNKRGIEKNILELREEYTLMNREWIAVQKMRESYSNNL